MNTNKPDTPPLLERLAALDALAGPAHSLAQTPPWWLAVLQTLGAWLAALLLLIGVFALFGNMPDNLSLGMLLTGALVLGGALTVMGRAEGFVRQMGVPLSLAAQALLASGLMMQHEGLDWRTVFGLSAALAAVLARAPAPALHRTLCAAAALGCALLATDSFLLNGILQLACALLAVTLLLKRSGWAAGPHAPLLRAWAHGSALVGLLAPWVTHTLLFPAGPFSSLDGDLGATSGTTQSVLALLNCLLPIATAGWLLRVRQVRFGAVGVVALLVLSVAAYWIPGGAVALALLLAAWQACDRLWAALATAGLVAYVSLFYYNLAETLMFKSALLAAAGLVLLGLLLARRSLRSSHSI